MTEILKPKPPPRPTAPKRSRVKADQLVAVAPATPPLTRPAHAYSVRAVVRGELVLELHVAGRPAALATIEIGPDRVCRVECAVLSPISLGLYQAGATLVTVALESGVTAEDMYLVLDGRAGFKAAEITRTQDAEIRNRWEWVVLPDADRLRSAGVVADLREAFQRVLEAIMTLWQSGRWVRTAG